MSIGALIFCQSRCSEPHRWFAIIILWRPTSRQYRICTACALTHALRISRCKGSAFSPAPLERLRFTGPELHRTLRLEQLTEQGIIDAAGDAFCAMAFLMSPIIAWQLTSSQMIRTLLQPAKLGLSEHLHNGIRYSPVCIQVSTNSISEQKSKSRPSTLLLITKWSVCKGHDRPGSGFEFPSH